MSVHKLKFALAASASLFLSGCLGGAVSLAGNVVEGAVNITGDIAEGAVDQVTTSDEERMKKEIKELKKQQKERD